MADAETIDSTAAIPVAKTTSESTKVIDDETSIASIGPDKNIEPKNTESKLEDSEADSTKSVVNKKAMTPTPELEVAPIIASGDTDKAREDGSTKLTSSSDDVEMSEATKSTGHKKSFGAPIKSPNKQNGDVNGEHSDDDVEAMEVDEDEASAPVKTKTDSTELESEEPSAAKDTRVAGGKSRIDENNLSDAEEDVISGKKDASLPKEPETVELADDSAEGEALDDDDDAEVSRKKNSAANDTNSLSEDPLLQELPSSRRARDDDEPEVNGNNKAKVPANGAHEEESVILDSDSEDEPMEVDSANKTSNGMNDDDDDKPVSIGSDTESESEMNTSHSNSRDVPTNDNSNDVHEILSDKEDDCVVIDDNKSSSPKVAKRKADDDEDPLGAAARNSSASSSPVSFAISRTPREKAPSLVVVDTAKLLGKTNSPASSAQPLNLHKTPTTPVTPKSVNLLPNLTDDMFVLEAPSFIVPYIYEKPPVAPLKEVVTTMGKEVEEQLTKEAETRRLKEESELGEKEKAAKLIDEAAEKAKKNKKKQPRKKVRDDEDWDEEIDSSEDSDEEGEGVTRVLIKDVEDDLLSIKEHIITPETIKDAIIGGAGKKSDNFFESPLGKFFMGIGVNLVQEHVQTDLLRQQKRKREKEGTNPSETTMMAINSLIKNLETSKENNAPFKFELKRCEYCNYKSESTLTMAHHYETPHMRANIHRCNFCNFETKLTSEILWHMEALHNIKGRLEKPISYHQCPNCTFEDNGRSKLARHSIACAKKFKPDINLAPPLDWDPPAKIPKVKPKHGLVGTATAYQLAAQQQQAALLAQQQKAAAQAAAQQQRTAALAAAMQQQQQQNRGRGRTPQIVTKPSPTMIGRTNISPAANAANANAQQLMQRMMNSGGFNLGMSGGQYMQNSPVSSRGKSSQPSISITPVPRQAGTSAGGQSLNPVSAAATTKIPPGVSPGMKPGQNPNATGKTQFVICEICDGYIKDLDQLRNHMQWIHKVKIHPKMIYNRPPLNCQKCQYRFFTDQGLERHLLGSHGLVTSSMQEAANKGKDAGRCPVCGRVYQWKLLNHVSRDHNMTLKPAHLSYKCTVCTATFGMYKQFESHVYSAHSTVAKKGNERKSTGGPSGSSNSGGSNNQSSLLKPLKINDEITIIPQPSKPVISNSKPIEIE